MNLSSLSECLDPRLSYISRLCFPFFFFFFLIHAQQLLGDSALVMHYSLLFVHYSLEKKYIKNGSHDTIHTFKNYFVTVFSVFNFQFQQK